jgi:hypothetical protein
MSELLEPKESLRSAGRPFPWFCPRCRRQEVWRDSIAYQFQRNHLGQRVTIAVSNLAVPKCRNCGELVFDYLAEQQLNQAFSDQIHGQANGDGKQEHVSA